MFSHATQTLGLSNGYLSLVFRLQAEPGLHTPPRLQEGLALGPV